MKSLLVAVDLPTIRTAKVKSAPQPEETFRINRLSAIGVPRSVGDLGVSCGGPERNYQIRLDR